MRTGEPIVYTSADSVFQIAAHEEVIPVPELYRMCEIARELLNGPNEVGRVIARPFIGSPGAFTRTANRHDLAVPPPCGMLLDQLAAAAVSRLRRRQDLRHFSGPRDHTFSQDQKQRGWHAEDRRCHAMSNTEGLIFVNLVDFDQLYGHRNDVEGYARALEAVDAWLPSLPLRKATWWSSPPIMVATPPRPPPIIPANTRPCWYMGNV